MLVKQSPEYCSNNITMPGEDISSHKNESSKTNLEQVCAGNAAAAAAVTENSTPALQRHLGSKLIAPESDITMHVGEPPTELANMQLCAPAQSIVSVHLQAHNAADEMMHLHAPLVNHDHSAPAICISEAPNGNAPDVIPSSITLVSAHEAHLCTPVVVESVTAQRTTSEADDYPATGTGLVPAKAPDFAPAPGIEETSDDAPASISELDPSSTVVLGATPSGAPAPNGHLMDAPEIFTSRDANVPYAPAPEVHMDNEKALIAASRNLTDAASAPTVRTAPENDVLLAPASDKEGCIEEKGSAPAPENDVSLAPASDKEGRSEDKMLLDSNIMDKSVHTCSFKFKDSVECLVSLKVYATKQMHGSFVKISSTRHRHVFKWEHTRDKWKEFSLHGMEIIRILLSKFGSQRQCNGLQFTTPWI